MEKPNIYKYTDYRNFLEDFFQYLKAEALFTRTKFVAHLGFASPSYFRMLMEKERALTVKSARKVGNRLGLDSTEIDYLQLLVQWNEAKTDEEKKRFEEASKKYRDFEKIKRTETFEGEGFGLWYMIAIWEALGTNWGKKSIPEMAQSLKISEEEMEYALQYLLKTGLIEKHGKYFIKKDSALETAPVVHSKYVKQLHKGMIGKASDAVDLALDERWLGGLTISLSEENFQELKKALFEFQRTVNTKFSEGQTPRKVYQFNIQLFPLFDIE